MRDVIFEEDKWGWEGHHGRPAPRFHKTQEPVSSRARLSRSFGMACLAFFTGINRNSLFSLATSIWRALHPSLKKNSFTFFYTVFAISTRVYWCDVCAIIFRLMFGYYTNYGGMRGIMTLRFQTKICRLGREKWSYAETTTKAIHSRVQSSGSKGDLERREDRQSIIGRIRDPFEPAV